MDKVSIVGDAIDYVRELQKELEEIEIEVQDMEQKCSGSVGDDVGSDEADTGENFAVPATSNPECAEEAGPASTTTTTTDVESSSEKPAQDTTQVQSPSRLAKKILEVSQIDMKFHPPT